MSLESYLASSGVPVDDVRVRLSFELFVRVEFAVEVGDRILCEDATVESNLDDWNGYRENLAKTGVAVIGVVLAMLACVAAGIAIIGMRRKTKE